MSKMKRLSILTFALVAVLFASSPLAADSLFSSSTVSMVIDWLGVGTATSQYDTENLYVKAGDDGLSVAATGFYTGIFEDSGQHYLSVRAPNSVWKGVDFNEGTTVHGGWMQHTYNGSAGTLDFGVDGASEMTMTSGGVRVNTALDADSSGGATLGVNGPFSQIGFGNATYTGQLSYSPGNTSVFLGTITNHELEIRINGAEVAQFNPDGTLSFSGASDGVILKSADGTCALCNIDNSDVFSCASTSCP